MSPEAIESALDSHEDELSRTAIDIGSLARRIEQLEAVQARLWDLLQLVPGLLEEDATGGVAKTNFLETLATLRAETPRVESADTLLTAQVRHDDLKKEL
jgi:hypothetical protein